MRGLLGDVAEDVERHVLERDALDDLPAAHVFELAQEIDPFELEVRIGGKPAEEVAERVILHGRRRASVTGVHGSQECRSRGRGMQRPDRRTNLT